MSICSSLGIDGIPEVLITNIDPQLNNEPWIIMEHINGVTLRDFVKSQSTNLPEKLIITRKLLYLIEEIHLRDIVHRYIKPENILVTTRSHAQNDPHYHDVDEVKLHLIDFSEACLVGNEENTQRTIFQYASDYRQNTFYQPCQLQKQSSIVEENEDLRNEDTDYHPSIDTSFVCAILFWLITKHDPKGSQDIDKVATHRQAKYSNIIDRESLRAAGNFNNDDFHWNFMIDLLSLKEFGQTRRNMSLSENIFN